MSQVENELGSGHVHYPTWQSRGWLVARDFSTLCRVLFVGGPPLLLVPIPVLGGWTSDALELPGPIPGQLAFFFPGFLTGLLLPFALLNLLAAASLGRRAGKIERLTLDFLDLQLGTLASFCMLRVETVRTVGQPDSRLVALAAAVSFLPGILVVSTATLIGLLFPMYLATLLTLICGTIPGWWLAYAPRFIRIADHAAYTLMTGRRPDYRLDFAPLEYDPETERRLRSPIAANAITDRSQLWRPRPKTPNV